MIYIRTDANKIIATGHVMRCLTIADEMVNEGDEVCFIVSDKRSLQLIEGRKYKSIVIETCWDNVDVEREFQLLKTRIKKDDWLLVDSYSIDNEYLKQFSSICRIAVFDDLFSEKKDADIIINYNIFYKKFDYTNRYKDSKTRLLLGEKYIPLRKQFKEIQPLIRVRKYNHPNILLMCGGGDLNNFICSCLKYIHEKDRDLFNYINWKVVIGSYYPHEEELKNFQEQLMNVEIKRNVENMASLMKECDMCITAASTVLYECAVMLLPTLFCIVADDQIYDAEGFSENGRMIYCGNYLENSGIVNKNIFRELKVMVKDTDNQQNLKEKMMGFIDSDGSQRITKALHGDD